MSFIFLRNRVTSGAAFSPASLFASGEDGAWYEPSPTTCFTNTAGTTAAGVGDAVARINDLSGNGNHATQATAAARPLLQQTAGGLYYLSFDGTDDVLITTSATPASNLDFFFAIDAGADAEYMLYQLEQNPGYFIFCAQDGGGGSTSSVIAGGGLFVDGVSITNNRNALHDAATGGAHIIEQQDVNLSFYITGARIGNWAFSGFALEGKLFGLIFSETLTADEITNTRAYLAAKSGVTLP